MDGKGETKKGATGGPEPQKRSQMGPIKRKMDQKEAKLGLYWVFYENTFS